MEVILNRDRNKNILRFVESKSCSVCEGARLNTDALSVQFNDKSIADYSALSIEELEQLFSTTTLSEHIGVKSISEKICGKTKLLNKLGLSYLTMDRSSTSLSGGEAQRIRLANQITNGL
jgi:excinuclease ABC subunit A